MSSTGIHALRHARNSHALPFPKRVLAGESLLAGRCWDSWLLQSACTLPSELWCGHSAHSGSLLSSFGFALPEHSSTQESGQSFTTPTAIPAVTQRAESGGAAAGTQLLQRYGWQLLREGRQERPQLYLCIERQTSNAWNEPTERHGGPGCALQPNRAVLRTRGWPGSAHGTFSTRAGAGGRDACAGLLCNCRHQSFQQLFSTLTYSSWHQAHT